ncbi:MAG: hypothetical protein OdinLCB4_004990 [Candidatus Odinarchaeum yellowstonii]|uniref:Nucleotidyltransferase family protein n=1 Tax=Odinarchaeota yellowstonii (strain LCB_4) TaxID=1841599 RepID=A0AAF0D1C2_ODILC|nr:MAG: hypothetical protein OdinLCB4_004990 [Candidatus Odinarchaeum yellowstonii]
MVVDKVREAKRIIDKAFERNVVLKLIGGLAVRNHCEIIDFCERDYSDIDFVGLSKQLNAIEKVFTELGYTHNKDVLLASGGRRMQFISRDGVEHIDVFLDKFDMDHDVIDLANRLNFEKYTISLSDILLTKLQIHEINEKDIRDTLTILKDIPYGLEDKPGIVNFKYIAEKCAEDWGLYYDVILNIDKCLNMLGNYKLTAEEAERIKTSLLTLRRLIEEEPKTKKWVKRSKNDLRKRWWNIIEAEDREKIRGRV